MPISLLPASAAAFAPRSAPNIVLSNKVEPWLTQTLKRINRVKRPLNSVPQHYRCLTETLSGESAIWTLCSLMVPKAPRDQLRQDPNPLVEGLFNYQLIHIEAYVVHVDLVSQHEVAFKLTKDTIDALVEYHKTIFSVDDFNSQYDWPEKEVQQKKLQDEFVQAVNRYVFRTGARALEGMEEEGTGELLDGRGDEVKLAINGLFLHMLPPPPRIVDVIRANPLLPSNPTEPIWWPSAAASAAAAAAAAAASVSAPPTTHHSAVSATTVGATHAPIPVEAWKILPSTPSPDIIPIHSSAPMSAAPSIVASTACAEDPNQTATTNLWNSLSMSDAEVQLPSPAPSFSQPFCTSAQFYSPLQAPSPIMPAFGLPNMLAQQCGTSAVNSGFGNFGWTANEFTPQYAAII